MGYGSVIFDMDGVILKYDSENFAWKYNAVDRVLKKHGSNPESLSRQEKDCLIGDNGLDEINRISEKYGLDTRETWEDLSEETSKARAVRINKGDFRLFDGVKETLGALNGNVEMALISNAPEMAVRETINFYDLKTYFSFYRGIEDFEDLSDRKPHPDHLKFAQMELKREPYLYVGDRNVDIKAARKAGMDAAIIRRDYANIEEKPDYLIDSISELKKIALS